MDREEIQESVQVRVSHNQPPFSPPLTVGEFIQSKLPEKGRHSPNLEAIDAEVSSESSPSDYESDDDSVKSGEKKEKRSKVRKVKDSISKAFRKLSHHGKKEHHESTHEYQGHDERHHQDSERHHSFSHSHHESHRRDSGFRDHRANSIADPVPFDRHSLTDHPIASRDYVVQQNLQTAFSEEGLKATQFPSAGSHETHNRFETDFVMVGMNTLDIGATQDILDQRDLPLTSGHFSEVTRWEPVPVAPPAVVYEDARNMFMESSDNVQKQPDSVVGEAAFNAVDNVVPGAPATPVIHHSPEVWNVYSEVQHEDPMTLKDAIEHAENFGGSFSHVGEHRNSLGGEAKEPENLNEDDNPVNEYYQPSESSRSTFSGQNMRMSESDLLERERPGSAEQSFERTESDSALLQQGDELRGFEHEPSARGGVTSSSESDMDKSSANMSYEKMPQPYNPDNSIRNQDVPEDYRRLSHQGDLQMTERMEHTQEILDEDLLKSCAPQSNNEGLFSSSVVEEMSNNMSSPDRERSLSPAPVEIIEVTSDVDLDVPTIGSDLTNGEPVLIVSTDSDSDSNRQVNMTHADSLIDAEFAGTDMERHEEHGQVEPSSTIPTNFSQPILEGYFDKPSSSGSIEAEPRLAEDIKQNIAPGWTADSQLGYKPPAEADATGDPELVNKKDDMAEVHGQPRERTGSIVGMIASKIAGVIAAATSVFTNEPMILGGDADTEEETFVYEVEPRETPQEPVSGQFVPATNVFDTVLTGIRRLVDENDKGNVPETETGGDSSSTAAMEERKVAGEFVK